MQLEKGIITPALFASARQGVLNVLAKKTTFGRFLAYPAAAPKILSAVAASGLAASDYPRRRRAAAPPRPSAHRGAHCPRRKRASQVRRVGRRPLGVRARRGARDGVDQTTERLRGRRVRRAAHPPRVRRLRAGAGRGATLLRGAQLAALASEGAREARLATRGGARRAALVAEARVVRRRDGVQGHQSTTVLRRRQTAGQLADGGLRVPVVGGAGVAGARRARPGAGGLSRRRELAVFSS